MPSIEDMEDFLPQTMSYPIKAGVLPVSIVTGAFAVVTAFMPVTGLAWFMGIPCSINLPHTGALGFAIGCDLIPGREQTTGTGASAIGSGVCPLVWDEQDEAPIPPERL